MGAEAVSWTPQGRGVKHPRTHAGKAMEGRTAPKLRLQAPTACSIVPSHSTYKTQIQIYNHQEFQDEHRALNPKPGTLLSTEPCLTVMVTSP